MIVRTIKLLPYAIRHHGSAGAAAVRMAGFNAPEAREEQAMTAFAVGNRVRLNRIGSQIAGNGDRQARETRGLIGRVTKVTGETVRVVWGDTANWDEWHADYLTLVSKRKRSRK